MSAGDDLFASIHRKAGQAKRHWRAIDSDGNVLARAHRGEVEVLRKWYRDADGVQIVRAP